MKKVQIIIEAELDEKELQSMTSSQNGFEPLTEKEYFNGIKFSYSEGRMEICNDIEEYYNINEGDSQCLKNPKLVSINVVD
jgi:hypothetical protein